MKIYRFLSRLIDIFMPGRGNSGALRPVPVTVRTGRYVAALIALLPAVASASEIVDTTEARSGARLPEEIQHGKLVDNTKVIFLNGDSARRPSLDSVRSLISRFYVDQFRHFQDPRAPYFMFMSKDANLAMGIGGVIRMRGWYDWNGSIPANGFAPYLIPIPADPTDKHHIGATPAGCAIFATIIGRNTPIGNFMGYIEGNFNGYNGVGFRLKKAYVTLADWTVGYATSTFCDPASQSPTIDGAGPNGEISRTNVLVRYLHNFRNGWTVAGSVEFPSSQIGISSDNEKVKRCSDFVPDLCAMGQYQWNGGYSHVRLSGLMRVLSYRDIAAAKNHSIVGWGLQLSSTVKIGRPATLYAAVNFGRGHSSYTGDMGIGNYDLVVNPSDPGDVYAPAALGTSLGFKYNFLPNLYSCLTLSQMRYFDSNIEEAILDTTNAVDDYKYGLYGALNLFWEITPRVQIGAELLMGERHNFSGQHKWANRIDALFQFSF